LVVVVEAFAAVTSGPLEAVFESREVKLLLHMAFAFL